MREQASHTGYTVSWFDTLIACMNNDQYNYDSQGVGYASLRKTEPAIAHIIHHQLGVGDFVLNVGAGAGSYEPTHKHTVAVEPSATMRRQRPPTLPPAINASAENMPFDDKSFDSSMAVLTLHHWNDYKAGLREMVRVTKGPVLILTFDPTMLSQYWFAEYAPEVIESDRRRFPSIEDIVSSLGGVANIIPIPVPLHCADSFQEAFYGRPEELLRPEVRASQSAWGFVGTEAEQRIVDMLSSDLASGRWDSKYGYLRKQPSFTCALRLIVAQSA